MCAGMLSAWEQGLWQEWTWNGGHGALRAATRRTWRTDGMRAQLARWMWVGACCWHAHTRRTCRKVCFSRTGSSAASSSHPAAGRVWRGVHMVWMHASMLWQTFGACGRPPQTERAQAAQVSSPLPPPSHSFRTMNLRMCMHPSPKPTDILHQQRLPKHDRVLHRALWARGVGGASIAARRNGHACMHL